LVDQKNIGTGWRLAQCLHLYRQAGRQRLQTLRGLRPAIELKTRLGRGIGRVIGHYLGSRAPTLKNRDNIANWDCQ
jgi:hypothetical protein